MRLGITLIALKRKSTGVFSFASPTASNGSPGSVIARIAELETQARDIRVSSSVSLDDLRVRIDADHAGRSRRELGGEHAVLWFRGPPIAEGTRRRAS
jgi:hypothetical protein